MSTRKRWIHRVRPWVPFLVLLVLVALPALARVGGGESYNSGRSGGDDDAGDAILSFIFQLLVQLAFEHPCVGVPLLIAFVGGWWWYQTQQGSASTRKAIDRAEASQRTQVSAGAVTGWVAALKAKDAQFDLLNFYDRTRRVFLDVQEAWFKRNLDPVRRFLSDATYSRLAVQLKILHAMGVRDAIADVQVLDLQLIGLEQTHAFDTLHVRVTAKMRDEDAPAKATDEQARALAMKKAPEQFVEVWSFVRKPGLTTRAWGQQPGAAQCASCGAPVAPGTDACAQCGALARGEVGASPCPNCGAPFEGGAANKCEHCGAILNSGHYDWVLAEITQASEYSAGEHAILGMARVRKTDPGLTSEVLEDRASLCFWKWVEAQVAGNASLLAKVAVDEFRGAMAGDLERLKAQGRRKVFLECTVGAVNTQQIIERDGFDLAQVEVRWSARMGLGPANEAPPSLPSVPQRWVFTLQRAVGAKSSAEHGVSTSRCPNCSAPLSDNGQPACEYCGTMLATGALDWVVREISTWEAWRATAPVMAVPLAQQVQGEPPPVPQPARVPDREERERLIYLMAAMAMADGEIDQRERQLLKLCSDRWRIPWANVELALKAGPGLFDRLMARGSAEAEAFLRELVRMALIDGKIDRKERQLLDASAAHLGLTAKLPALLKARG